MQFCKVMFSAVHCLPGGNILCIGVRSYEVVPSMVKGCAVMSIVLKPCDVFCRLVTCLEGLYSNQNIFSKLSSVLCTL